MIAPDILLQLVPEGEPRESFPDELLEGEVGLAVLEDSEDSEGPERRLGPWAAYLRHCISREMQIDQDFANIVNTSGFVGTGVFRVPNTKDASDYEGFPIVNGFQFGAVLLRAKRLPGPTYVRPLSIDDGRYRVPIIQSTATFNLHSGPSGYVAATFTEDGTTYCGITARHVVEGYRLGQKVPVECSSCGIRARLRRKAPGLIDAAVVEYTCGRPFTHPLYPTSKTALSGRR